MSPGAQQANLFHLKTDINPFLLAIPAAFDIVASTLMNIALTMVAASVYQMLRGTIIIVTAAMMIIFLKKKLYIQHYSSMLVITLALVMVGLASIVEGGGDSETNPVGLIILLVA